MLKAANTKIVKYLVFAVIFLHIVVSPILVGAHAAVDTDRMRGKIKVSVYSIPIFVKTLDLHKAISDAQNYRQGDGGGQSGKAGGGFKKYLLRAAKIFITRVRVRAVDLEGVMGSGDAAVTAVAVGSIGAGYDSARAVLGFDGECNIRAEYDYERIFVDLNGIISFCLADTMYALIAGAIGGVRAKFVRREVYG